MLVTVIMKLMAPRFDDAHARQSEKLARSTDGLACALFLARGG